MVHPAALDPQHLLAQCEMRRQRRSGPGGQHRNKVETAVVLLHASGVTGAASERRSQNENRQVALFRLRCNLALSLRQPLTAETPSELWRSRCRKGRVTVAATHTDFPALLAEALDTLAAYDDDLAAAAEFLGCTTSQLTKLLKLDSRALQQLNDRRRDRGLRPLS